MNDLKNDDDWEIDRVKKTVTHCDGFVAEVVMGEVRNIVRVPAGMAAREIPAYVAAAEAVWRSSVREIGRSDSDEPSAIAALIGHGPPLRKNVKPVDDLPASPSAVRERKSSGPTITVKRRRKIVPDGGGSAS